MPAQPQSQSQAFPCNLMSSGDGRSRTDGDICHTCFIAKLICSLGTALPRARDDRLGERNVVPLLYTDWTWCVVYGVDSLIKCSQTAKGSWAGHCYMVSYRLFSMFAIYSDWWVEHVSKGVYICGMVKRRHSGCNQGETAFPELFPGVTYRVVTAQQSS